MVVIYLKSSQGCKVEGQRYKHFANSNWSVANYAKWLVGYHSQNDLSNSHTDKLVQEIAHGDAAYDPNRNWNKIDIKLLCNVEENTPFVYPEHIGNNFSHIMPDYGFQKHYKLISKYYQYGPRWNDFVY